MKGQEQTFQTCAAYGCKRHCWRDTRHCKRHGGNNPMTAMQERWLDRGDLIVGPLLVGARPHRLWKMWRSHGVVGLNAGWLTASIQYRRPTDA